MGRYTAESTGMDVMRPIAAQQLRDPQNKARVWSNNIEAWGWFSSDGPTEIDEFLVWCSISPGDRILISISNLKSEVCVVVGVWKEEYSWIFRLINQTGRIVDISIQEQCLFKSAWKFIR